jgi:hypothetical protein
MRKNVEEGKEEFVVLGWGDANKINGGRGDDSRLGFTAATFFMDTSGGAGLKLGFWALLVATACCAACSMFLPRGPAAKAKAQTKTNLGHNNNKQQKQRALR